jgi:hypothetical protein
LKAAARRAVEREAVRDPEKRLVVEAKRRATVARSMEPTNEDVHTSVHIDQQ